MPIGTPELIIVLVIALIIFGPKKLPQLGRSLGSGMREFKSSISGGSKDDDEDAAELGAGDDKPAASTTDTPAGATADKPAASTTDEPAATAPRDAT